MQACPTLGPSVSLRALLPEADFHGADDIALTGCACDSRLIEPGHLFAAFSGVSRDGRDYIDDAVARGCVGVLAEPPAFDSTVPVCVVRNARESYARVCQVLAGRPSERLKVVGITGTNGKTTTACLVASVLSTAGIDTGLLGTLGYFDGAALTEAPWTTPPADVLAASLARMVANGCTHAVMEVSSHALDQHRVAGVRFDTACVTNVRRDHLDYHITLEDYRITKSKLLEHLAPEGVAVVNADDATSAAYLRRYDGPALTIGIRSSAEITGTPIEQCLGEQTFLLTAGSETVPVRTRMIGLHHIYNCLTAAAVGLAYGIDLSTVVRGLEAVQQVRGRLEPVVCGQPFGVYVDFAHTPDALSLALGTLRPLTQGKLICVFGAGGERDVQKRPLMGRAVEQVADVAIVTNDNPRGEEPTGIIADILRGLRDPQDAEVVPDRATAIRWALGSARPGDCVLIAGKGHERCQIIGDQKIPFDDRELAREWLYEVRPFAEEARSQ